MKILYLLDKFPRKTSETFIVNEMMALKELGHTVIIAANGREGVEEFHEDIREYRLLDDTYYPSEVPNFTGYKNGTQKALDFSAKLLKDFLRRPLETVRTVYRAWKMSSNVWIFLDNYLLARRVQGLEIDIVHAPFAYPRYLEQAVLLSGFLRRPFTCTFRAGDLYTRQHIKKDFLERASRVFTISNYNKSSCMERFGMKDVEMIHSSIDIHKFQPSDKLKRRKIICVCRFVEQKGVEYLIEACKILKKRGEIFELTLIGSGPLGEQYAQLIKSCDLQERVTVKGPLTQGEVKKELDDSMIFVLPCVIGGNGERDILPNALKEAMAMEVPVITSDICGIEELVEHQRDGLLVPAGDSLALAAAIGTLLADKALRDRLGQNGRKKIEKEFNIEESSKRLEQAFKEVLDGKQISYQTNSCIIDGRSDISCWR